MARRSLFGKLVTLAAVAYPLTLVVIVAVLWIVGERWWPVLGVLYLPRWGWGLPLPAVVLAIVALRRWRLLALQALAAFVLLFPLMGLSLERARPVVGPSLKVYTRNIHQGRDGLATVMDEITAVGADIVLLQETRGITQERLRKRFGHLVAHTWGEFTLITRLRVVAVHTPEMLIAGEPYRSRFVRYTLETPLGMLDVFNVHPLSPREALEDLRGAALSSDARSRPTFLDLRARRVARPNTERRRMQVAAFAALAAASRNEVVIGGDTNLPEGSWILRQYLSRFQDAFDAVGWGFGYTFPAKNPWMRIDRILTSHGLQAASVHLGSPAGSDHIGLHAVITTRR